MHDTCGLPRARHSASIVVISIVTTPAHFTRCVCLIPSNPLNSRGESERAVLPGFQQIGSRIRRRLKRQHIHVCARLEYWDGHQTNISTDIEVPRTCFHYSLDVPEEGTGCLSRI